VLSLWQLMSGGLSTSCDEKVILRCISQEGSLADGRFAHELPIWQPKEMLFSSADLLFCMAVSICTIPVVVQNLKKTNK
jgi:hypothetical protein